MKKTSALTAIMIILILCLASCGKPDAQTAETGTQAQTETAAPETAAPGTVSDSALVGSWEEDVFDSGFIFNADGTGTDTFWDLTFTYSTTGNEVLIVYDTDLYGASNYTYSISGDTLSMTRIDEEETPTFTYQRK